MIDWEQTVIRQYANSPRLLRLLSDFNDNIDSSAFFDLFYDNIWNPQTATGYGLDVWGRIVGVSRVLKVTTQDYFGFSGGAPDMQPFNQAPFYSGGAVTSNYALSDTAFRRLIFAKAAANITDCSITSINEILMKMFAGRGDCYVSDLGGMAMQYVFKFTLQPVDVAVILNSGVLPRPAGVQVSYAILDPLVLNNDFGGDIA